MIPQGSHYYSVCQGNVLSLGFAEVYICFEQKRCQVYGPEPLFRSE
jgi:hypothetical protein